MCFDSKLIVLQTLCNDNNKPLLLGVYGIPPGDILTIWFTTVKADGSWGLLVC